MTELREIVAVGLYLYDEFTEEERQKEGVKEHCVRNIMEGKGAEHCGDCTNVAHSCDRCHAEYWLSQADAALAAIKEAGLVVMPAQLTEAMYEAAARQMPNPNCIGLAYRAMIEAGETP